jgi:hypothetical protein
VSEVALFYRLGWSGQRESNPRIPAWKAGALPLGYVRMCCRSGLRESNPYLDLGKVALYLRAEAAWCYLSGQRGSNPRLLGWEPSALPLSYARK